jgi:hypothetical protein
MQRKTSGSRFVALAVIPAVASSVGTYAVTRAMYERTPARVAIAAAPPPVAVAPLILDAYAFPGAETRGTTRSGDLESREYETDASVSEVAQHYRQHLAPSIRVDYSRMPMNGSFTSSSGTPAARFSASGRVKVDARGNGNGIFVRQDGSGTLTVAVAGHKAEKTTIFLSYAAASR